MKHAIKVMAKWFTDWWLDNVFNFPWFYSQQLFNEVWWLDTSINEKISYESWRWSSMSGKRTLITSKNVWLNDMADPFINSHLVGVNWWLVLTVFDDIDVEGSQCRLDSRHYYDFYWWLWFEPYDQQSLYDICYNSFMASEQFWIPVIIRITNNILNQDNKQTIKFNSNKSVWNNILVNDHQKRVIHPTNYIFQYSELLLKKARISEYINKLYDCEQWINKSVKVVFGCNKINQWWSIDKNILQLFTLPLPDTLLTKLQISEILEHWDAYIYEKICAIKQQSSLWIKSDTWLTVHKSNNYIISTYYKRIFDAIRSAWFDCVVWDLWEYTCDTDKSIDYCLSFWASLSVAMGIKIWWYRPICVTWDWAYYHSGKNVLPELKSRKIWFPIIIFKNWWSQWTWWQYIPFDNGFESKNDYKVYNYNLNDFDFNNLLITLKRAKDSVEPIIIQIDC